MRDIKANSVRKGAVLVGWYMLPNKGRVHRLPNPEVITTTNYSSTGIYTFKTDNNVYRFDSNSLLVVEDEFSELGEVCF